MTTSSRSVRRATPRKAPGSSTTELPKISERTFQSQVEQYARLNAWLVYHTRYSMGSTGVGFPDLVLIRREMPCANLLTHGHLVVAELKSAVGKTTAAQDEWLALFATVPGATVKLWRPDDESWADIAQTLGR